jgi:hypothetical protein
LDILISEMKSLSPDPSPKREGGKGEEMRNERPPLGLPEGRWMMFVF